MKFDRYRRVRTKYTSCTYIHIQAKLLAQKEILNLPMFLDSLLKVFNIKISAAHLFNIFPAVRKLDQF